jgi:hypothetical protein
VLWLGDFGRVSEVLFAGFFGWFFHVCLVQKTANTDLATLIFREEFMFGSKFAESLICNGFL